MLPLSARPTPVAIPRAEIAPTDFAPGVDPASTTSAPIDISAPHQTEETFGTLLGKMVGEVNASQQVANQAMGSLQAGNNVSLHQAMIAVEEASVSFQLMVEVRNRLLDAYQEIMRMQV
jgi:flagellar hook-basal body complex protein FliE